MDIVNCGQKRKMKKMSKRNNIALRKYAKNMSVAEAKQLLQHLRWKEDDCVINCFDEKVWLKPCFGANGNRIGITDCCFANNPCGRHKKMNINHRG